MARAPVSDAKDPPVIATAVTPGFNVPVRLVPSQFKATVNRFRRSSDGPQSPVQVPVRTSVEVDAALVTSATPDAGSGSAQAHRLTKERKMAAMQVDFMRSPFSLGNGFIRFYRHTLHPCVVLCGMGGKFYERFKRAWRKWRLPGEFSV